MTASPVARRISGLFNGLGPVLGLFLVYAIFFFVAPDSFHSLYTTKTILTQAVIIRVNQLIVSVKTNLSGQGDPIPDFKYILKPTGVIKPNSLKISLTIRYNQIIYRPSTTSNACGFDFSDDGYFIVLFQVR